MRKACELLASGGSSILEISNAVGYINPDSARLPFSDRIPFPHGENNEDR